MTMTIDTRTHVMGDLLMITGTFTGGQAELSFDGLLSTVFAAGGHITSRYNTGIQVNEGDGVTIGETAITVDTVDARIHFNVGETVYTANEERLGVITALGATTVTIGAGALVAMIDDDPLFKHGANTGAVTLTDDSLKVDIDEQNNLIILGNGHLGAASSDATTNTGRFWILGQR
tara:strand:+ start:1439 stop:1966 length:528 start_codon:yes stop_codon:yes gene_type:complete